MFMLPRIHIEIERWKFNKNYQIYVSNLGNFKDKSKETIKPKVQHNGYLMIPVCNNKKGIIKYIAAHRIVMETWCPRAEMWKEKLTVDHLDHNKRNNNVRNLEWVTQQENCNRAAADFLCDDKDKLIQSLQDKIKNLEDMKKDNNNDGCIVAAVGVKRFYTWDEVKDFLVSKNPDYINIKNDRMRTRVLLACSRHKKYMDYNWKKY